MKSKKIIFFVVSLVAIGLTSFSTSILFSNNASGAETGACQPSATGSYKNEWTDPEKAFTQDDQYAVGTTRIDSNEQDYYNFNIEFINFYEVTGIIVYMDAYGGIGDVTCSVALSWDGGSSWTSFKNSDPFRSSDTDTYLAIGTSNDDWKHSWTQNELSNSNFRCYVKLNSILPRTVHIDHIFIYIFYAAYPSEPTCFEAVSMPCSKDVNLSWVGPVYNFDDLHDYVQVQRKTTGYPTSLGDGDTVCYVTGSFYPYFIDTTTEYNTLYYYSAWAYNATYDLWSSYVRAKARTPCNHELTIYENLVNVTGGYEEIYDPALGWTVWNNYTGN